MTHPALKQAPKRTLSIFYDTVKSYYDTMKKSKGR